MNGDGDGVVIALTMGPRGQGKIGEGLLLPSSSPPLPVFPTFFNLRSGGALVVVAAVIHGFLDHRRRLPKTGDGAAVAGRLVVLVKEI